jgi:hypothetical protein
LSDLLLLSSTFVAMSDQRPEWQNIQNCKTHSIMHQTWLQKWKVNCTELSQPQTWADDNLEQTTLLAHISSKSKVQMGKYLEKGFLY